MNTSEQTSAGYEIITSYLKERENCQENWSYYGLLLLHQARKLIINQEIYNAIEEKVNKEQTRYAKELEIYWKEVITELNKKDSVKRKFEEEKENLSPQSKKSRSTITLFCMVQGNVNNAFSININKNKTITGIDPDQLKLWQVEIPDEHYDELVNLQLHKNKELLATKKISKYFIKDPVDKHIHTIVSLPETTKTRQELELTELELINKVAELQDPSLSVFSLFNCGFIDLNDEKSQVIIKHLMTDLNFRFKAIPIGNEASKSQYVCSYLVAIANLFEDKFKICPEKNVSGLNGHGPVDFALIQVQTSRIIGITEVKDKDFQQGVAQNAVQCESALSSSKKKVFGIITDSEKWFFLECSLDNKRNPKFKLSKPVVIIYGDEDMENWVKKVLGHIAWLLEEAQKLNELEDKN
ncbi:hypothetical protein RhiirB3_449705 [Rhizophagus irregularis]|nr:hypothetical protein RhiirB3_449705 [Rhizophagus irregularis]